MEALQSMLNFKKKMMSDPQQMDDHSEATNPLLSSPTEYRVAIAIDFGTDGVAIAYAYNNQVYPHTIWEYSQLDQHTIKPKAQILLNENGKKIAFGKDAQINYMITDSETSKYWMLFENFKMHLYDPSDTFNNIDIENIDYIFDNDQNIEYKINDLKQELESVNGIKYSSELVFIEVFKYIHSECKRYLKKQKIKVSDNEIEWILTVPSIWNEKAKYRLKQWAEKANIFKYNDQCKIVYEPDAASIFIQHELYYRYITAQRKLYQHQHKHQHHLSEESKSNDFDDSISSNLPHIGNLSRLLKQNVSIDTDDEKSIIDKLPKFEKETQYILIDGGGGTVDIACHEVVGEFGQEMGVKEVLPPTGGAWGSSFIDEQYKRLLINLFNKSWIDEYIVKSPNGWTSVMDKFRISKSSFFVNPKMSHHEIELPLEFLSFLEDKMEEKSDGDPNSDGLEEYISKIRVDFKSKSKSKTKTAEKTKKHMIGINDNVLLLAVEVWKSMFNSVINPIIKHCEQLLESEFLYNVQFMCLVGGLSSSKYFQKRINKSFGMDSQHRLEIIIPSKPILSIVLGAAYLSITKNYIRSRILNATYGIEIDKSLESAKTSNVSDHHIEHNKYWNTEKNEYFVRHCFSIYAKKKETIISGQIIEKTYNRIPIDAKKIKIKIFYSVISDPTVTTSAQHLADLIIKFNDKDIKQIVVEFHFYDTLIKVYTFPKGQKQKIQQIKLNYALTDID